MQPRDQLTKKEVQVATLVFEGLTNREIAKLVGTTEQVVKNYLRKVYDKLGVADRLELALFCLHNRVIENQKAPQAQEAAPAPTNGHAAAAAVGSSQPKLPENVS